MIIEFDAPLLVASLILGLVMLVLWLALDPFSDRWPRWATYAIGTGCIYAAFVAVQIVRIANPVLDLSVLIVAAMFAPTAGRAWMYWQAHEAARREARADEAVRLAELEARKRNSA